MTAIAILVSATVAAIIALMVGAKNRLIAKKRAAMDFILTQRAPEFVEAERVFSDLAEKGTLPIILHASAGDQIKVKLQVQSHLNHWELLAVSVFRNIVDEDVCKLVIGDKVCRRWENAKNLIEEIRVKFPRDDGSPDEEYYENFAALAKRWKENPRPKDSPAIVRVVEEVFRI